MNLDPKWAWAAYVPDAKNPWNLSKVGHLYRRATCGVGWERLQHGLSVGPEQAVDELLKGIGDLAAFEAETAPLATSIRRANNGPQASAWWLYRLIYSPHPLREKMTLFWHNHFATSNAKVQNAGYMLGQYDLMYRHALDSFAPMLQEMSVDPAMLIWLDTTQSVKGKPNENYARELMELFSLGIGNYTEDDIREAARAFTGYTIRDGKGTFNAARHDPTDKKVLGRTGKWKAEDIVKICLDQPACPRFLVKKLFRFLVSETIEPTPALIDPLADLYEASGFDTGGLVKKMLRSNLFFSPEAYRTRVKSPVDFVVGIVAGLEARVGTTSLATALASLGQDLFNPPSVKGWDGGTTWLNGQTLLARNNLALDLTSTENSSYGKRCDPVAVIAKHVAKAGKEASDAEIVSFFLDLFLQGDVPTESRDRLTEYLAQARTQKRPIYWTSDDKQNHRIRTVCRLVLTLPEFHLS